MLLESRPGREGEITVLALAAILALGCRTDPGHGPSTPAAAVTAAPPDEKEPAAENSEAPQLDSLEEGISRLRMGLADDAIELLESSLAQNAQNVRALYFLGLALAYDYRFAEARSIWYRALAATRDRLVQARVETTIGLTYEIEGQSGEAVEHFQAALNIVPNYPIARDELSALRRRGPVRCLSGNWTEAFALFLFADLEQ